MNPAILNYLQYQQGQPQGEGQASPMQPQGQQAPYNPFDSGIRSAIESAKQSLGMTEKQQDKALRRSMLTFADNMAQQPKQRGFFNNFGAATRALSPAIAEHDQAEDEALTQNNAMANQILAYKAAEEAKQVHAEQQAWQRQHAEAQLGETRRAHDMMNAYQQEKLRGQQAPITSSEGNFIPIESKSERLMYTKDKKASGEILHELSSIKKDYEDFRKLTKDDIIDPMTPYGVGTVSNKAKDFFGYFGGDQKETNKRKALEAKLGKFAVEIERKIKGGVLSEGMVKRFESKGLLPSLTDTPQVFEEKLNNLMEEMGDRYKASDASLRYNAHISPYDLAEQSSQREESPVPQNDMRIILMQDVNGMQYEIPAEEAENALNDGLTPVK
jgi:hypothetical protein